MKRYENIDMEDTQTWSNQVFFTRQLWNMLVLARVITIGAYNRNESRGAHYKPEFPDRNDDEWLKTTLEYQGREEAPKFTYEPVDVSLIPPRKRDYTSKSKGGKNNGDNQSVKDTPEELRQNDSNTNEKEQKSQNKNQLS